MKQLNMRVPGPVRQKGASFWTVILIVAILGFALLAALKVAPAYLDNNVIANAVEGVRANNDVGNMTIARFRTEVMKTIRINGNRDFDASAIVFTREGSNDYIDVNYETRVHLFYNIDAIVMFENRFDR